MSYIIASPPIFQSLPTEGSPSITSQFNSSMQPPSPSLSPPPPHVVTTLNKHAWEFHLCNYPDCKFVNTLLHIIDHGALLCFNAANHPQHCKNLASCADKPEAVTSAIDKLVAHSHVHGPYLSPPLKDFCLSPLGLAKHK